MAPEQVVHVNVAYATGPEQVVIAVAVPGGTTVDQAIALSGIRARCGDIQADPVAIGIYGKVVTPDTIVRDGDRIEIYRPLVADPKQARRRRAAQRS